MNEQMYMIKDYLEKSYSGARMMDDAEGMVRIARALAALQADVHKDIFVEGFEEDMIETMAEDSLKKMMKNNKR